MGTGGGSIASLVKIASQLFVNLPVESITKNSGASMATPVVVTAGRQVVTIVRLAKPRTAASTSKSCANGGRMKTTNPCSNLILAAISGNGGNRDYRSSAIGETESETVVWWMDE